MSAVWSSKLCSLFRLLCVPSHQALESSQLYNADTMIPDWLVLQAPSSVRWGNALRGLSPGCKARLDCWLSLRFSTCVDLEHPSTSTLASWLQILDRRPTYGLYRWIEDPKTPCVAFSSCISRSHGELRYSMRLFIPLPLLMLVLWLLLSTPTSSPTYHQARQTS